MLLGGFCPWGQMYWETLGKHWERLGSIRILGVITLPTPVELRPIDLLTTAPAYAAAGGLHLIASRADEHAVYVLQHSRDGQIACCQYNKKVRLW